jgi:hypothetical protein
MEVITREVPSEIESIEKITDNFSIGKFRIYIYGNRGKGRWEKRYLLFHTNTLRAISAGTKPQMKKLAKIMEDYVFDGVSTWTQDKSTIRSLQKLSEIKWKDIYV